MKKPKNSSSLKSKNASSASYIAELARELETLAASEGLVPLRELLRVAKEEARRAALGARS